ncbi:MAG: phage protein Gp36 family protein [Phycisphaerae bacterium]
MPTYATSTDLNNFFSSANITDWADKDRDGSLSSQEQLAIDAGIEASEAIVDNYLQKAGFAAPFDATDYANLPSRLKSLLRQWTVVIAGFHLYAWRGLGDKANPLENLYRQTIEQLKAVADGLPLAGLIKEAKVSFGFEVTSL